MSAPLSDYWTVEYHFFADAFSVKPLPDYLRAAQQHCRDAEFFDSVLLAIHPTEVGASDECSVWQERRNQSEVTFARRVAEIRPRLETLERRAAEESTDS